MFSACVTFMSLTTTYLVMKKKQYRLNYALLLLNNVIQEDGKHKYLEPRRPDTVLKMIYTLPRTRYIKSLIRSVIDYADKIYDIC